MMTRGGEGGKKCQKFDDVICERPLRSNKKQFRNIGDCRFTTYRHRFARAAPAPRAKRNDAKIQKIVDVHRPSILVNDLND